MTDASAPQPSHPHMLLIVPAGWHDHPPGLVALREALYLEWGATFAYQKSTSYLRVPVPLLSGVWPAGIDARLEPLIMRAFYCLDDLDAG